MRLTLRRFSVAVVTIVASILLAGGAGAQTVSPLIAPARIHVESVIGQGEGLQLPPLAVANQGDSLASVRMAVTSGDEAIGAAVDPGWVRFSPDTFVLERGAGTAVDIWLDVPSDALPGTYHARLRASFEDENRAAGTAVAVQAAVASDLRFVVEERKITTADRIESWWSRYGIAAMLATGVGTVTFLFMHVTRNFEIRRRGSG
jgi:hypothetical protein